MVIPLPRLSIRDVLLVIVTLTWAVVVVTMAVQGRPLPTELWLIPAATVAAILKVFPGRRPPDDREGG